MTGTAETRTADVLERIVSVRRRAVEAGKRQVSQAKLLERVAAAPAPRDFAAALTGAGVNVIAELKKASPSRGVLREAYNPAALAADLEEAGAAALSVLTEPDFFQGGLEDLQLVRTLTELPLLRKDFLFDPYQVYEARAAGADAFLLIVALLDPAALRQLLSLGKELGMAALVEVHAEEELKQAVDAGAKMVGVNNRNLKTLEVSLETSRRLVELIPQNCVAVSESGLRTHQDLKGLRAAGYDAFLIGEHLMQASEPGKTLRTLLAGERV